jgi:hypothetical protein
MRMKSPAARILASTLIVMFPLPAMPPTIAASGGATISGTLFSASSSAPLAGARLFLKDPASGASYTSSLSGADGSFDTVSVPASSYRVAIESNGGLYVVDTPVTLDAGSSRHLRVAVREMERARAGRAEGETPPPEGQKAAAEDTSFWSNPLTATLVVVGGAILVGVLVDNATNDDDEPASAFAP